MSWTWRVVRTPERSALAVCTVEAWASTVTVSFNCADLENDVAQRQPVTGDQVDILLRELLKAGRLHRDLVGAGL